MIRNFNWSDTSLGDLKDWPQSLRTTLSIILRSKFPMFLFWGPELICFYNDAYRPSLGNEGKHPMAMGMCGEQCWPEIWKDIKPLIDQVLSGGEASWREDQLLPIYRNGKLEDVYWTYSYSPVNDESGKPYGVFVVCTETTDKVQHLKEATQSKDELEFAINAAELGTWDFNPYTCKFTGNNRLKEWFGLGEDEEIDLRNATNVISELDRTRVSEAIQTALTFSSGGTYNIEYTIINPKNQKERVVVAKGKALFDDHNLPTRFNGTLQDITDETIARRALEEAEEWARLAAASVDLGTYNLNFKTGEMETSPRFDAIFGFKEKMPRASYVNVIYPDDQYIRLNAHRRALKEGRIFYEVRVIYKENSIHWVRVEGKVYYHTDGEPLRMLGTVLDITDNKQTEEELLIINKRLEIALAEQKDLQRQKDDFLGIASHELKTPVTSIKAYTQVLERILVKKGDVREADMMKKMDAQLNRLTSLIGDLLDVTKMNSGRLQFNDSEFDFNETLRFIIEDLQRTTEKHTVVEAFEEVGIIYADQERIGQVLTNLISNAIKYSPDGDTINVHTELKDDEIIVCVEDHGIGIPKEKLDKVFEQFYRVSGDKQHTFPGLGLGLYISSEIIKREGGRLWVNSTEGKGSTFCFSLPLHKKGNNK